MNYNYFLSVERCLADIYDNKKICRKSFNDYNDSCYPDQKIQLFEEMSSLKKIDPYLKILEEPGDTRFRYFRLKNYLLSMVWIFTSFRLKIENFPKIDC